MKSLVSSTPRTAEDCFIAVLRLTDNDGLEKVFQVSHKSGSAMLGLTNILGRTHKSLPHVLATLVGNTDAHRPRADAQRYAEAAVVKTFPEVHACDAYAVYLLITAVHEAVESVYGNLLEHNPGWDTPANGLSISVVDTYYRDTAGVIFDVVEVDA